MSYKIKVHKRMSREHRDHEYFSLMIKAASMG